MVLQGSVNITQLHSWAFDSPYQQLHFKLYTNLQHRAVADENNTLRV
jgi:hypothetical protein